MEFARQVCYPPTPLMGISLACAQLMAEEHRRRAFFGSLLQLGRQRCAFDPATFNRWCERRGIRLASALPERGAVDDHAFFRALGFTDVQSLDRSDFEGANVIADLNDPLADSLAGRFDAVFNGGTLEHVFDVRAALANVCHLLREGGRAVHVAPASNQLDHGFYSFSPTLFADYYAANAWEIPVSYLFQARDWEAPWTVYRYDPAALEAGASRFHDVRASGVTMAGVWMVAEKTARSTSSTIPQQGQYVRRWGESSSGARAAREPSGVALALRDLKRRLDRALPMLNARVMPPLVGVYG